MGSQNDSIDISQLKAQALGISDGPALRATSATSQSVEIPKSPKPRDAVKCSPTKHPRYAENAAARRHCHAAHIQEHDASAALASHCGLPSTLPDPSKTKMQSNGTPSDGDTQPASQAVYGMIEQASTRSGVLHIREEGETGHINLLGCLKPEAGEGDGIAMLVEENEDDGVELVSQDIRAEPFPESLRFHQPKTPLTQGTKRKHPNQDTPQMETPRLPDNPFIGLSATDMMRPSQIFRATQAETSPQFANSDGLYERPSPNINNLGRPSTAGSLSSPAVTRDSRSSMIRAVTEPQVTYISMKESQEARERRLQEMRLEQDDLSDDEFGPPSHSQPKRSFVRDQITRGTKSQLAKKTPPPIPIQKPSPRSKGFSQGNQSPRRSGRQASELFLISDDPPAEQAQGNITEDETEREEEKEEKDYDDEIDELAEDNKENVEVPMTVSRLHHAQVITSQSSPSRNHVRRRTRPPSIYSATQVRGSPRTKTSPARGPASEKGTQPYAVRDSQSSQKHGSKARSAVPTPSGPQSSSDSRNVVLQSQLSQKSRSPIPSSSIPGKAATRNVVVHLTSSSPPQLNGSQSKPPEVNNARSDSFVDVKEHHNQEDGTKNDDMPSSDIQTNTEQVALPIGSQNIQSKASSPPAINTSTIPDTNSTVKEFAPVRKSIPNSSQDMSSSGLMPSSASRAATNPSLAGQSLGTTLYETAREQLSVSPSKNDTQRLQTRSQRSNLSSPTRHLRHRTLGEIAADPSPPDPMEDVNLSDFGLLNKEDEDFQNTIRRRSHQPKTNKRTRDTSTTWKVSASDPPFERQRSPPRPTSSALSAPTQVQMPSVTEPQSFSPFSPPPASQLMGFLSPAVSKEALRDSSALRIPSSSDAPVPKPTLKTSASNRPTKSSVSQTNTHARSTSMTMQQPPSRVEQTPPTQTTAPQTASSLSSDLPVVAPDRVFAHFNGKQSAFYTATCLGVIPGDEPRYSIHYDDGAQDSISAFGIKRLEFKPGDVVKVDLPIHRMKNYVVVGVQDKQEVEDPDTLTRRRKANPDNKAAWPETDIHGYAKVLLSPKQRNLVDSNRTDTEQIVVGMYHLYFTQAMWTNIKDREYTHVDRKSKALGGLQTPSERPSTPSSPPSRAKRNKTTSLTQSISINGPNEGLFENMIFSLTNIHQPADLDRAKSLIIANGGKVLEDGFDSLFHVPILHRITSPKKSDSDRDFHPTRQAQSLGFTCLIADKYCRRAKYIQALALGIPCLATRWISDCVSKERILPWSAYLLPAGESTFLGGATRSRILPPLPAETATLSTIIEQRPSMLEGTSILLIMSKNEEETMRQHPLLTFALGPTRVARALSIEAAAKAVAEAQAVGEPWDWVFSYDREREVERILFGSAAKKRKSRAGGGRQGGKTRVMGNEFVVQSLILGQLIHE